MDAETLFWLVAPGLGTGIGGLGLLLLVSPGARAIDTLLGFTAGVMLAATAFSLLVPALDRGALGEVLVGFTLGAGVVLLSDSWLPHEHPRLAEGGPPAAGRRTPAQTARLLLAALTIHNVPEGAAVGVAFAAGGTELGIPIALAIGIQNIPEGFAAAAPLEASGVSRRASAGVALLTGLVEPPAAIAAFAAFELASSLLAAGLAFAAGAMLYVVVDELVPESHGHGNERVASIGLIGGFALMMALDNAFG
jgi:zinc transporter, ZIP family